MSRKLDHKRLSRLRKIDELLSGLPEGSKGMSMSEIIDGFSTANKESLRLQLRRDLEIIQELMGSNLEIITKKEECTNLDMTHQVRTITRYRYKKNASLFSGNLSKVEKDELTWALKLVNRLKGAGAVIPKILKTKLGLDDKSELETIISYTVNPKEDIIYKNFNRLSDYIKSRDNISLRVKDRVSPQKTIEFKNVSPGYLREYNRRWYLIGHDNVTDKITHFALDRISGISKSKGKGYKKLPDIEDIFKDVVGISIPDSAEATDIVFWAAKEQTNFIETKPIHSSQTEISEIDEITLNKFSGKEGKFYRIHCIVNYELKRDLMSYGADIIILSPSDLVNEIRSIINKMQTGYNNGTPAT